MKQELTEQLDKLSKSELIDLLDVLVNNNSIHEQAIQENLVIKEMSSEEMQIVDKLNNSYSLNDNEKAYIKDVLEKKNNTKLDSLLHNKNKFIKALTEFKVQRFFTLVWECYPKKVGKQVGYKAFVKLIKDFKLKDLDNNCMYILQKIKQYKQTCENNQTEEQFIMHFATFCNSKKYL